MNPPVPLRCRIRLALVASLVLLSAASLVRSEPLKPAPLSTEQQQQLRERDRLEAEAKLFRRQGKPAEAIAAAEKMLAIDHQVFGRIHKEVAFSLGYLAGLYEGREDFPAARKARQQVVDIQTKLWGASHWRVIDARLALADTDRLIKLKPEQRRQLAEASRLGGEGVILYRKGNFRAALHATGKALALRKEVLGAQHPAYATSLHNLASLYQAQGDYAKAEPFSRQALAIWKQVLGARHPTYAAGLTNLALLYNGQGDYARAEPLYQQALAIKKQALGAQHPGYATGLNNLAGVYKAQGDYARAESLYQKALALTKQALGEQHPVYATSLNNLAGVYQAQGDYARAELLSLQALAIRKKALGAQHPVYAQSLNNLAGLYQAQGDYARAEPLHLQALAIWKQALGERHPDYATSLNNLAVLYKTQGDYARAEPLSLKALALTKQALGEQHPAYAQSLNNLAGLYKEQGDYVRAEPLYQQARAITKKALGAQHPAYALSLNNLAGLYNAQGDHARAEPLYLQALAVKQKALGEQHPVYATSLNNLAVLYYAKGDSARAERFLRQGLGLQRRNLDLAADAQSERQQLAMIHHFRGTLDGYLSLTPRAHIAGANAYAPVLAWKGAVCARQRRNHSLRRLRHQDPALARLAADLQRTGGRLAALAFAVPDPKKRAAWQRQLEDLSERKEQLEKELARHSAAFRAQWRRPELTPAQLQAALPRDAALLDFLEYTRFSPPPKGKGPLHRERHLAVFVVRPGQPIRQFDLGPVQPIRAAIDRWRLTLQRSRPRQGAHDPAIQLRQRVWQPLAKHLDGVKTVLVSPDGALTRLPFAALPGKDAATYLIEEVVLAVVSVPQLLPELLASRAQVPEKKRPAPTLLALGDVHYNAAPDPARAHGGGRPAARRAGALRRWPELDETRVEILAVRDSFEERFPDGRVKMLRQGQATAEALRRLAPRHRYLHLATHGFFAPPELRSALAPAPRRDKGGTGFGLFDRHGVVGFHPGLLSGLVLAGANRPPQPDQDDGILTALEVADLDLDNVELAVLSACETGLGEVAGGEGLLGLQRAFQVAGARSVIASLWKVQDKASRELLVRFYKNLWGKKLSRLEALREAQLWMLREGVQRGLVLRERQQPKGKARTPPLYWAAFQLSGDWR